MSQHASIAILALIAKGRQAPVAAVHGVTAPVRLDKGLQSMQVNLPRLL